MGLEDWVKDKEEKGLKRFLETPEVNLVELINREETEKQED